MNCEREWEKKGTRNSELTYFVKPVKPFCWKKKKTGRSYCCTIVQSHASRNSNSSSCSIDRQLFELFVYEKLLSEFQLGRPCGCSIDISLIRAVSRKIVRRSLQGSHNPRLSWQRTRTKKETSLEAIGQAKYKVTLFTYCKLGWVLFDERFC